MKTNTLFIIFVLTLGLLPMGYANAQDIACTPGSVTYGAGEVDPTYAAEIAQDVAGLEQFWTATLPQAFGVSFTSPCIIEYAPATVPFQETCGLTPDIATQNAFYCYPAHAVMWDGPTFYQPIYDELGDQAVMYITAHEYGHAAQYLSGELPARSVNRELQADCYAGAYVKYAEQLGHIGPGEYREVFAIVTAVGQSRVGSTWFTRTHGTSLQRNAALLRGYENGVSGCQVDFESLVEDGIERPQRPEDPVIERGDGEQANFPRRPFR